MSLTLTYQDTYREALIATVIATADKRKRRGETLDVASVAQEVFDLLAPIHA